MGPNPVFQPDPPGALLFRPSVGGGGPVNLVLLGPMNTVRGPFHTQVVSDVLRDGLGIELVPDGGVAVAEVFRCDANHTVLTAGRITSSSSGCGAV
jgi:hypothetical protein